MSFFTDLATAIRDAARLEAEYVLDPATNGVELSREIIVMTARRIEQLIAEEPHT